MEQSRSASEAKFLAVFDKGGPVHAFDTLEDLMAEAAARGLGDAADALRQEYERAQRDAHGLGAEDFASANAAEVQRIDEGIDPDPETYADTYDLFRAAKEQELIHSVWIIPVNMPTKMVPLTACVRDFGAVGVQVGSVYLSTDARCFLCSGADYGGQTLMCFGGDDGRRWDSPADISFLARSGCPV